MMTKEPKKDQAAGSMENQERPRPPQESRKFVTFQRSSAGPRKRHQKAPGGWLNSPGSFFFFVAGFQELVRIANSEHLDNGKLSRVAVGGYQGDKRVYLWSTHESDPDGIEVKEASGRTYINIADYLASMDLRPEVGLAQRFDLLPADGESPVQPALMIHLDKPLESKRIGRGKKDEVDPED